MLDACPLYVTLAHDHLSLSLSFRQSHCGFNAVWLFIVAFKSYSTRKRWYANSAEIDLAMKKRSVRTMSGESPFRYFDGATMVSYQVPSRTVENVYCRRQPTPLSCINDKYLYNPELSNVPVSSLEVKKSKVGEYAGRGLFTKVDVPEDVYIAAETAVHSVRFFPSTRELIFKLISLCEQVGDDNYAVLEYYMDGYGFASRKFVRFCGRFYYHSRL